MKRSILILCLILFVANIMGQSRDTIYVKNDTVILKKDTAIRNKLIQVNIQNYIGKTVDELLSNDTIASYKSYFFSEEPPRKLNSLYLEYARGLYIIIKVYPLLYQSIFSEKGEFSFELYKKEKISKIKLDKKWFEENVVKKYSN